MLPLLLVVRLLFAVCQPCCHVGFVMMTMMVLFVDKVDEVDATDMIICLFVVHKQLNFVGFVKTAVCNRSTPKLGACCYALTYEYK